jgi:hypothetical protein
MAQVYEVCRCDECTHKRLVDAAPALLAALKAHLPWHVEPEQGWGCWADAVAAIEQAEGRADD